MKSVIFGISSTALTEDERQFFKETQPLGFILFKRNIDNPEQVRTLVSELKSCVNHDYVPILIDQEGGRVSRLTPPNFRNIQKPASFFGKIAETDLAKAKELVFINYLLIGKELASLGINVDCAPVADMSWSITHDVIGDRSFSANPNIISELCHASYQGLKAAGVDAIIKHIPGHGRATADSHLELPRIDAPLAELEETDFIPFTALPMFKWAMTAHIIYSCLDAKLPVTQSKNAINYIRETIGFQNVLISDDINMKALSGSLADITNSCYEAGCDVILHCSGNYEEMKEIAPNLRTLDIKLYQLLSQRQDIVYEESIAHYISTPEIQLEKILSSSCA